MKVKLHMKVRPLPLVAGLLAAALLAGATTQDRGQSAPDYPRLKTLDVVDDYHGTKVADPFRWLEDLGDPDTHAFVEAQNRLTRQYVDIPSRPVIRQRLEKLIDYPRVSTPGREGDRLFYSRNTGLQNQSVQYMKGQGSDEEVELLDPNEWSADGTVALAGMNVSHDASMMIYGVSVGGSDQREMRVMKLAGGEVGELFPETMKNMRFAGTAWHPEGTGFWYNQYPMPGTVPPAQERLNNKVFWHELGTEQSQDVQIHAFPADPELSFFPWVTPGHRYLIVYASRGTDRRSGVMYREIAGDPAAAGGFTQLFSPEDARYSIIDDPEDGTLVVLTDKDAPRFRLVQIDLEDPSPSNWQTIIPEPAEEGTILNGVDRAATRYVAEYMQDARSVLKHYALDGSDEHAIDLPTIGSVAGITANRDRDDIFFGFTSFTYPATPFHYDLKSGRLEKWAEISPPGFDPDAYETRQIFYTSNDGTRVPMFITHRKGLELDGDNPTILYGYGGFLISETPGFSALRTAWLEQGGVYALANLRGGGEYGEPWHEAGMRHKKQNTFDDFHAAAEYLIAEKYTRSDKLAIQGGSNGGLLVAAAVTQRPELYGAVLCHVPVIDMLRYHTWGTGRFWTVEYGNAIDSEADFRTLYAYSPLHNIGENVDYPPILTLTADGDDRVVPYNAFKFVATLQQKNPDTWPLLLRHDVGSGHGAGKPISKTLDEQADLYAFLVRALGMDWEEK